MDPQSIVKAFNEQFHSLTGSPVVVYGTGIVAAILAQNSDKLVFRIVGFLDRDRDCGLFEGFPVIKPHQSSGLAGQIIIAAPLIHCWEIYQRIAFLEADGLRIYFPNGRCYSEKTARDYLTRIGSALFEKIRQADVVSFDCFDTLIMRKCLRPEIVFDILETRLERKGLAAARQRAAELCGRENPHHNLGQLYECGYKHGLWGNDYPEIMAAEISLETQLSAGRADAAKAFEYARQLGKTIVIVSDMYLPSAQLKGILERHHFVGYDDLFVSCDLKAAKFDRGNIWPLVQQRYHGRRILHIGDNQDCDFLLPRDYDIDTYRLPAPEEVLSIFGLESLDGKKYQPGEWLFLGLFAERVIFLAAAAEPDQDKIELNSFEDFGYLFFGPATYVYTRWLVETASHNQDEFLLFFARDSFVFKKICDKIIKKLNLKTPATKYLYISRKAIISAYCETADDIREILLNYGSMVRRLSVAEGVGALFEVELAADGFNQQKWADVSEEGLADYVTGLHSKAILKKSEQLRAYFLQYLNSLSITSGTQFGAVDFASSLKTHFALQKISRLTFNSYLFYYNMNGMYYFKDFLDLKRVWALHLDTADLFTHLETSYLAANSPFCEIFYTSPEASLAAFGPAGKLIFQPEESRNLPGILKMQEGAEKFADDILSLGPFISGLEVANVLFGAMFTKNIDIAEDIKQVFQLRLPGGTGMGLLGPVNDLES